MLGTVIEFLESIVHMIGKIPRASSYLARTAQFLSEGNVLVCD